MVLPVLPIVGGVLLAVLPVGGVLLTVLPGTELWVGDTLTMQCHSRGAKGVIWAREHYRQEEEMIAPDEHKKELIAHDAQILLDDARIHVETGIQDSYTVSTLQVRM